MIENDFLNRLAVWNLALQFYSNRYILAWRSNFDIDLYRAWNDIRFDRRSCLIVSDQYSILFKISGFAGNIDQRFYKRDAVKRIRSRTNINLGRFKLRISQAVNVVKLVGIDKIITQIKLCRDFFLDRNQSRRRF